MPRMSLKAARINAGYTQKEAAKLLAISNKTLGNWENGISLPNAAAINRICALYNVTYDNLIFRQ